MSRATVIPRHCVRPSTIACATWRVSAPAPGFRTSIYARVARDASELVERELEAAFETVGKLVNPVLTGTARGR